jgi:predicted solute-binding protein
MEATYPSRAVNVLSYRALYSTAVANFQWMEWGVKNATTTATSTAANVAMLQRMVEDLGLKANTQQWQFTATLTLTT